MHPGREVVEHARRGQHREHPVGRRRRHAVRLRGGDHAVAIAAPVEQAEHGGGLAEPGHRDRPPRIDPELQRVAVPPDRQQPRLQCWSHVGMLPPPSDIPPGRPPRPPSYRPFRSGTEARTRVVISAASGSAGTRSAAVATSSPHSPAPAASPISTPNRRTPCGVS